MAARLASWKAKSKIERIGTSLASFSSLWSQVRCGKLDLFKQLQKWNGGEKTSLRNNKLAKWQVDGMAIWWIDKLMNWQVWKVKS